MSAPSSSLCLMTALAAIACVVGPRSLVAQDHAAAEPGEAPRIAVWTDDRDVFHRSDRVPVFFRSATDGYVTIFRIDTDGRVRILFPREPWADNSVAAEQVHRVPGPSGRTDSPAFVVDDYPGVGYLFAVVALEPFDYGPYVLSDHWEPSAIGQSGRISGDPYVAFADIVEDILPVGYSAYAFDHVPYFVGEHYEYPRFLCYDCHAYVAYPVWDPYRYWCGTFRIVIYEDVYTYAAGVYPPTQIVFGNPAALQPRFVFKTRTDTDPYLTRVRGNEVPAGWREPDRGVRGADVGGVGTIPAPLRPRGTGLSGFLRRILKGGDAARSPEPAAPADPRRGGDAATGKSNDGKPAPDESHPQLERRGSGKQPEVQKKPPEPGRRPTTSPGSRRPGDRSASSRNGSEPVTRHRN